MPKSRRQGEDEKSIIRKLGEEDKKLADSTHKEIHEIDKLIDELRKTVNDDPLVFTDRRYHDFAEQILISQRSIMVVHHQMHRLIYWVFTYLLNRIDESTAKVSTKSRIEAGLALLEIMEHFNTEVKPPDLRAFA